VVGLVRPVRREDLVRLAEQECATRSKTPVMERPKSSSPYGTDQPPWTNPPLGSSCRPPGAWYTPSSVTNIVAVSFISMETTRHRQIHCWRA